MIIVTLFFWFSFCQGGSTLVWDISVVGWDVVYGEEFIPSDEKGYTVIVQKTKKLPASTEPIRNAFTRRFSSPSLCEA